jgi:subtilisin-like proprotein convertase family protein
MALLVSLLVAISGANGQVATAYAFSQTSGSFALNTSSGTVLWNNGLFGTFDDNVSGAITIPAFNFNGSTYTQVYISSNGFITFGTAPSTTNYTPLSSTATYAGAIAAFGQDIRSAPGALTANSDVRYFTQGNEFVVQWRNVRRYLGGANSAERFSFQIRLNTATSAINAVYSGITSQDAGITQQPEVGLRGPNNAFATNVNNRRVTTGAENWSSSLAGTANSSTCRFTSAAPAKGFSNGQTYTWAVACTAPTATASVVANCATSTYMIQVSVSSLGSAPSVTIQSPSGTNVHANVGTGSYNVGPVPFGTARTVTVVHNGLAVCNLSLGSFNYIDGGQTCHAAAAYPIADNGCGTNTYTSVPVCVSSTGTALGQNVFVRSVDLIASHTWGSDLRFYLRSPDNTEVALINTARGGSGTQFGNAAACPGGLFTFQQGGAALTGVVGASTNVGTWQPDQSLDLFHNGQNPNGNWTLRACDAVGADVGAVRYARVNLCTPPAATFTAVDACASNQFSVQVNVTSHGGGTSANLSYTVNGTPFTLNNLPIGTTTIGPFAATSEVACTVTNNVSNCGSVQATLYSNCPITITCGSATTLSHCYRNNDTRTFHFIASNPFETITLSFISGSMHANDVIRAYSGSDSNGAAITSLTGSFANLGVPQVTGSSSGPELFLEIDSDASNSCATGQQSSWVFEAECTAGCADPDAGVTVNTNCAAYDFTIDVEVLYTGDAATTTLRYSVNGGTPIDIPGLMDFDTQTIGPFAIGDQVNVRLLHGTDAACDRNFGNFTNAPGCPSAENCVNALNLATQTSPLPGTTVGRVHDFTFACGTATANTAPDAIYFIDVPDGQQLRIRQQVNNYNSQHYVRYGGTCPGATVIACVNDDNGEVGWVEWINNTGTTQRVWWIQDGFGTAAGTFTLEWQLLTCPLPTAQAATGITNNQAGANYFGPAGNYIVEYGPAATFTTPGSGATPGPNGTVITTPASPTVIGGLSANTPYRYFVRRDCGGGSFSPNSAGILFTTTNTPTTVVNGSCGNNLAITDNGCGTSTFTQAAIAITGQPNALGSNVGLSSVDLIITHTYRADLSISLISPGGQEVQLISYRGGSGDNYGNNSSCPSAYFRLVTGGAALTTIPATTANVTGNYAPEQPLSSFNSGNPNGSWILKVCDNAGVDVGAIRHVRLNFQPIDCLGVLGGTAMPGTSCNDGNACTINDIWNASCACTGTFQDTDGDGTCNANDGCPNDPNKTVPGACGCGVADVPATYYADSDGDGFGAGAAIPGFTCNVPPGTVTNDTDGCPTDPNKQSPGACGCGVADVPAIYYADADGDGFGDANDSQAGFTCATPNGYVSNSSDLCPADPNKQSPGVCGCGIADTDTDGDAAPDCVDPCPFLPGLQDGDVCDANPGPGYTLGQVVACSCQTVACSEQLNLEFQSDGMSEVLWSLHQQGTNTLVQSGGGFLPPSQGYGENTCLPTGCYYLVVSDDAGDGIAGPGGYILRELGGRRIIDNRNNFTTGYVSQIANGEGFCLPLGDDRLIYTSCDKLDWKTSPCGGEYIVANDNAAVTAQYGVSDALSGYQMWWFNPNGGYSFKRYQSHSTHNGLPHSATRACHFRLNSWSGNQLQQGQLYNVKVRGRLNGTYLQWGPACRFMLDDAAAQCPRTKLMDIPGNQYLSCGQTRSIGTNVLVHARPVKRMTAECVWVNANKYEFRFRIPAEGITIVKTSATGQYWVNTNGLACGATYDVDVRASFDNGATWCHAGDPYGDVCLLTTTCSFGMAQEPAPGDSMQETRLLVYPNPNRGDQLHVRLTNLLVDSGVIDVEVFDAYGKRAASRRFAASDGQANGEMELSGLASGMYLITITAGAERFEERLVIHH